MDPQALKVTRTAIAGGLARFGNLPLVELDGDGRWSIASRTVLPMDGSGPALEMARQAATYYAGR
ncbi:hypothetical protein JBE27_17005 [Streptomyces albiflaviniger]|nr:hypothetical protein [Streptomyces albiflaviniger]